MTAARSTFKFFTSLCTLIIYTCSVISDCWAQPTPVGNVNLEGSSRSALEVPANTILPTEITYGTVVGTTVGAGEVSQDGAATYNIPLWVPPGRAGLEPNLSLDYSSFGANGLLGVGWQLSGLPRIERCRRTIAQDGEAGPTEFGSTPASKDKQRFCLNGERLVPVKGSHGAAGTEYRTERDTFTKIIQVNDTYGIHHFNAYTKEGRILTFGDYPSNLPGHVIPPSRNGIGDSPAPLGKWRTLAWALTSVEDRSGNAISISYQTLAGEVYPIEIRYNASPGQALPGTSAVWFSYEERPDKSRHWVSGFAVEQNVRLKRIEIYGLNPKVASLLRSYNFTYSNDSVTQRSLLSTIQECDGLELCKLATKFRWALGGRYFKPPTKTSIPTNRVYNARVAALSLQAGDFNGDGLHDIVNPQIYGGLNVHLSDGTTIVRSPNAYTKLPNGGLMYCDKPPAVPVDVNQDGKTDVVWPDCGASLTISNLNWSNFSEPLWTEFVRREPDNSILLTGINQLVPTAHWIIRPTQGTFVDLNGDGAPELVRSWFEMREGQSLPYPPSGPLKLGYHLNQAGRLHANLFDLPGLEFPQQDFFPFKEAPLYVADIDGSGRGVLLGRAPANPTHLTAVGLNSGGIAQARVTTLPASPEFVFADVNGDGLVDAVHRSNNVSPSVRVRLNNGLEFESAKEWEIDGPTSYFPNPPYGGGLMHTFVVDFNGDGNHDILLIGQGCYLTESTPVSAASCVLESDGRGAFTRRVLDLPLPCPLSDSTKSMCRFRSLMLDANGDGQLDLLQEQPSDASGYLQLYVRGDHKPDLLVTVENGFKIKEEFSYVPLQDAAVYTPGPKLNYPQGTVSRQMWVVRQHRSDDGIGGTRSLVLRYEDGRVDLLGRGWLGFAQREVYDIARGVRTRTWYDNSLRVDTAYPFAGIAKREVTEAVLASITKGQAGIPFSRHVHVRHTDLKQVQTGGGAYYVHPERIVEFEDEQLTLVPGGTAVGGVDKQSVETSLTMDLFGNVLVRDAKDRSGYREVITTSYDNDALEWQIGKRRSVTHTVTSSKGETKSRTIEYDYDAASGLLTTVRIEPSSGGNIEEPHASEFYLKIVLKRDPLGMVLAIERSGSGVTRIETIQYDSVIGAFPTKYTNAAGHVTLTAFHPGLGVLAATEDRNGVARAFHYDGFARLRSIDSPDAADTTISYGATKEGFLLLTARVAGGATKRIAYDALGREVRKEWKTFDDSWVSSETNYDTFGNVRARTLPPIVPGTSRKITYGHDNIGRVVSMHNPDGTARFIDYQLLTTRVHDEKGNVREFNQDSLGRVSSSVEFDGRTRLATQYEYEPFGSLEAVVDPKGHRTSMKHDVLGRRYEITTPDTGTTTTHYNAFGEVTDETDATQDVTIYTLDGIGRVKQISNMDGQTSFVWDTAPKGIGQLASASSPDGITTTYGYDALARVSTMTVGSASKFYSIDVTYDSYGRVQVLKYPSDPGSQRLAVEYQYTSGGELLAVLDASRQPYWTALTRNPAGQLTAEKFGNSVTSEYKYDNVSGRLHAIDSVVAKAAVIPIQQIVYGYEANGNVQMRTDVLGGTVEIFGYDGLDRLTSWTAQQNGQVTTTHYGYDALGNLESRTTPTAKDIFQYAGNGAGPHALTMSPAGTYHYDAKGNQKAGPGRTVEFSSLNLPSAITTASGITKFSYDAIGARTLKQDESGGLTFNLGRLYERRTTGLDVEHVFSIPAGNRAVAHVVWSSTAGGPLVESKRYLHVDGLGSVDAITDDAGSLVERFRYEPFGARRQPLNLTQPAQPASKLPQGFTGHRHDDEFGLIDMGGRAYEPSSAHFLAADPLIRHPLWGQSYNRFSYVMNNPLTLVDPSGFSDETPGVAREYSGGGGFFGIVVGIAASLLGSLFSSNGPSDRSAGHVAPSNGDRAPNRLGPVEGITPPPRPLLTPAQQPTRAPVGSSDGTLSWAQTLQESAPPPLFPKYQLDRVSENTKAAVEWLATHYPGLFPQSGEVVITEGDPGEGNLGSTNHLGNIVLEPGHSIERYVGIVAHELLHSRYTYIGRYFHGVRLLLDDLGITHTGEHQTIHKIDHAIAGHFSWSNDDPLFLPEKMRETVYGQVVIDGPTITIIHTGLPAEALYPGMGIGRVDTRYSWPSFSIR
jgi:RHS repeat-associated protein